MDRQPHDAHQEVGRRLEHGGEVGRGADRGEQEVEAGEPDLARPVLLQLADRREREREPSRHRDEDGPRPARDDRRVAEGGEGAPQDARQDGRAHAQPDDHGDGARRRGPARLVDLPERFVDPVQHLRIGPDPAVEPLLVAREEQEDRQPPVPDDRIHDDDRGEAGVAQPDRLLKRDHVGGPPDPASGERSHALPRLRPADKLAHGEVGDRPADDDPERPDEHHQDREAAQAQDRAHVDRDHEQEQREREQHVAEPVVGRALRRRHARRRQQHRDEVRPDDGRDDAEQLVQRRHARQREHGREDAGEQGRDLRRVGDEGNVGLHRGGPGKPRR